MRAYANLLIAPGTGKPRQVHASLLESFNTEQSVDNDIDSFSVNIGDAASELLDMVDRDVEVRVGLFCENGKSVVEQVFAGLVDVETFVTEKTHTLQGGDIPSSILAGTDAEPGYWRHVDPQKLLIQRCRALGLKNVQIARMKQIGRLWSDASEKEWSFQYRVARSGGCFMWSDNVGKLIIDVLNYAPSSYSYSFGRAPRGESQSSWIGVEDVSLVSNKQQRIDKARVYGEDKKKKGVVPLATSTNPSGASIRSWLRRPVAISTLTTARTQKDLDDEAKLQVFESIVGAQEYVLTILGDIFVQQNRMARVNLPEYGLVGRYYIVGVSRSYSDGGITQDVRLRERGFAIDKRVPTAPTLSQQPNAGTNVSTANVAEALSGEGGVRWAGSFVRAAREFGVANGWDFSVFLGVLLSMCQQESGFHNEAEGSHVEWFPMPTKAADQSLSPKDPITGTPIFTAPTLPAAQQQWRKIFANSKGTPDNPYPRERGVGPMQLTDPGYKQWADDLGWDGSPPTGTPEYAGGRWNPESNIRASARVLIQKLKAVGADPTNPGTIWAGVAAYNGSGSAAANYAAKVRNYYTTTYGPEAAGAVTQANKTVPGSAQRSFKDGNGNVVVTLPANTPATVAKAITWAMNKRGDPYEYGGRGPHYDCSSFVDHALVIGDPNLAPTVLLTGNGAGQHGASTFTLRDKGKPIAKNQLLPGDLVFFYGQDANGVLIPWDHVGMFIGDGLFVHDPHTGDVVKVSSLGEDYYRDNYLGARRFLSWPTGPR